MYGNRIEFWLILQGEKEHFSDLDSVRQKSTQCLSGRKMYPTQKHPDFSGGQPQNFRKNMPKFAIFFENFDCKTKRNRIKYMLYAAKRPQSGIVPFYGP